MDISFGEFEVGSGLSHAGRGPPGNGTIGALGNALPGAEPAKPSPAHPETAGLGAMSST